jgi:hypothetical protein
MVSPMKERDFKVGDKVRFQKALVKDRETMKYLSRELRGEGVLVGFRTVHDMRLDYEDGYYIVDSHRVALVADDLYTNPNKIPLEHFLGENPR